MRSVRESRYALLQGFFHGADDTADDGIEDAPVHLRAVGVTPECHAVGRPLASLDLAGARVTALVRRGLRTVSPSPETPLQAGDTLVLSGTIEQLGDAEGAIQRG